MSSRTTQSYRTTLSGSVGAGMGSLFNPNGRKYYILEHKVSSKYHKAGESQEIIVDNIELGRDSHCQVRFDDSFKTVSRHHAGIVRDGDGWKLVQISQKNSTFLNGRPVTTEWYLQNGDEIQLSVNGPKLGFILPAGKKSTVGSIGLTRRLSLFRQQALRPYKTALTALSCVLVLAVAGLSAWNFIMTDVLTDNTKALAEAKMENSKNKGLIVALNNLLDTQGLLIDSLKNLKPLTHRIYVVDTSGRANPGRVDMSACYPHIYHITRYAYFDGKQLPFKWYGTGFQLDEGKFVTARHVVCPYYSNSYYWEDDKLMLRPGAEPVQVFYELLINALYQVGRVTFVNNCVSPSNTVEFEDNKFSSVGMYDKIHTLSTSIYLVRETGSNNLKVIEGGYVESGWEVVERIEAGTNIREAVSDRKFDYAYAARNVGSGLKANKSISSNLKQGTMLHILGYPHGWGKGKPIYSSAVCSQDGLNKETGVILASNDNTEGGNSGGPIFIQYGSSWEVVALVSGGIAQKSIFVPITVIP